MRNPRGGVLWHQPTWRFETLRAGHEHQLGAFQPLQLGMDYHLYHIDYQERKPESDKKRVRHSNCSRTAFHGFFNDALFQLQIHRGRRGFDASVHLSNHDGGDNGLVFQGESRF